MNRAATLIAIEERQIAQRTHELAALSSPTGARFDDIVGDVF
jgi:hypothetical protein